MKSLTALALCLAATACGPIMEANRPDPVDIKQFVPGQRRIQVLAELGAPMSTVVDSGKSCDIYKLYTHGPGAVGKGAIAAGEAIGDVFTLGLSEVLFTPAEAMTKNSKHAVLFCYDAGGKLISATESDTHVDN